MLGATAPVLLVASHHARLSMNGGESGAGSTSQHGGQLHLCSWPYRLEASRNRMVDEHGH